jgi:LacI family repressor for deo operon, udp, cdd, tsx, nupC, and nupG
MSNIHSVAKRAGVSTATVSRALTRPHVVAPDTRRRVLTAVAALDYAPNSAARHLRTLRSRTLLVMLPDISKPFYAPVLQGIEDAAHREGYAVLLGDTRDDEAREERYSLMLRRKEADGLVVLGHRLPKVTQAMMRAGSPERPAVVNCCAGYVGIGVPSVHIDNLRASTDAMNHLYALGHRRIGLISGIPDSPVTRERVRGARVSATAHGASEDLLITEGDFSAECGAQGAAQLLGDSRPPTALFCFNDEMALGAMDAARQRGLRVPEDLSVVGFDDIPLARYMSTPLTTIAQPMREIGEHSVRLLLDMLDGRPAASLTLPHQLMIRNTTAPPRQA